MKVSGFERVIRFKQMSFRIYKQRAAQSRESAPPILNLAAVLKTCVSLAASVPAFHVFLSAIMVLVASVTAARTNLASWVIPLMFFVLVVIPSVRICISHERGECYHTDVYTS
jgi:hypothetical protein